MTPRKPKEEHKPSGRPTSYKASYNKQAEKLCLLGATDKELADFFEVCEDTVYEWKKKYPKFTESIKKGKIEADVKVAQSLYKKANGYNTKEITFEKVDNKVNLSVAKDGISEDDTYKKKVVTKEVAPDTAAICFWLKNRQPDKWREKKIVENHNRDIIVDSEKDKEALEDV